MPTSPLQAGSTSFGTAVNPASSDTGVLGPLASEYGALLLQTLYDTNPYVMLASGEYANIIPGGAGTSIAQWIDIAEFPDAMELTEGVTPAPTPVQRRVIQKKVRQYGQSVILTDQERGRDMNDLPSSVVERLTQSFMSTSNSLADTAVFLTGTPSSGDFPTVAQGGAVMSGTDKENGVSNAFYGKGASGYTALTTDSDGGNFSLSDIRRMAEHLRDTNVPMKEEPIYATDAVSTSGRPKAYWGIVDTVGKDILFSLTEGTGADKVYNFQHVHEYADARRALPNEIGSTNVVRWLLDTNEAWAGTGVAKGTGRRLSIHGKGALGMAAITPENFEIVTFAGASAYDPLAQLSGLGWKGSMAYTLLSGGDRSSQLWYTV